MESPPLVKAAASIMRELCYSNKEELQAGFITAGWDRKKGPQVMLCYTQTKTMTRSKDMSAVLHQSCVTLNTAVGMQIKIIKRRI